MIHYAYSNMFDMLSCTMYHTKNIYKETYILKHVDVNLFTSMQAHCVSRVIIIKCLTIVCFVKEATTRQEHKVSNK
jgi:hypothetical protein